MGIQKPAWLEALCRQNFFAACSIHEIAKKNEKNICCLDCCTSICPHCVQSHRFHRLLQVRRYVYHDVVRLEDLEKLIDCSNVQAYTINSAKVVFIKKRPQNRQFKGSGNYCTSCDRSLQEPFTIAPSAARDLSPFLRTCNSLQLGPDFFIPQDMMVGDDDRNNDSPDHSTIVDSDDQPMSYNNSQYSSSGNSHSSSGSENMMSSSSSMLCITEFVRKKRSGVMYVCGRSSSSTTKQRQRQRQQQTLASEEDMATSMSRRKGIPQRSPMC